MQATLNIITNPFHPLLDRVQKPIQRRVKVNTLVNRHKVDLSKPVICYYNGAPILRKQWSQTVVSNGDVVSFVYLPQGGGGGSNIMKLVLMVALAVFLPGIGAAAASMMGVTSTIGISLVTAGIGILGNVLINALIPPPQPPKAQQAQQLSSPSPTYTIGAQGNTARLGQAIPVLYGRMKLYPDFAAQPYAEYEGNNQYLYQLFCVTQGKATINNNDIYIEDSPLSGFGSDYQVEVIHPGQSSALFPTDVYSSGEVSGQELDGNGSMGPFVLNPTTTTINKLAFDVVMTRGLGFINDDGVLENITVTFRFSAQKINDAGANVGSSFVLATESVTAATNTAIRKTYKYDVTPGRYKISAERIGVKSQESRRSNDIVWASARGYSSVPRVYGDMTLLAVKLKATNAISSQSSRKINILATRRLSVPVQSADSDAFEFPSAPEETRSIAWAIADMCKAAYGAGVTEARYDLAQLKLLDDIWTARGDTLNCVFDSTQTFWEALCMACRAGRVRPYVQGGMIHFVRDALQSLPTAMFTNRNIVKGSFKITYIMPSEDNADCIDVEYFDETIWKPRVVRASLDPGIKTKPAKIKAFGITNREQAYKEGMYAAGGNRYRRKEISFETELEGHVPSLGDLVAIQSDIPEWGQHGEVIETSAGQLVSSEPFTWTDGAIHYAMLRRANGSAAGPIEVTKGATDATLVFDPEDLDFELYAGYEKERTHISFGRSGQVVQLARILTTTPRGNNVQITAINEDARVHSADGTALPLDVYEWSLTTPKIRPILTDFNINQIGSGTSPSVSISWSPTPGATKYFIEKSTDNENWETLAELTGSSFSFVSNTGELYIRMAAFGGILGPYVTKTIQIGLIPPPADVSSGSISANGQSFNVSWAEVADCDAYYVEVLNAGFVKRSFNTTTTNFAYSIENAIDDGGPWRAITARIKAKKGTVLSETFLTLNGTNAAPSAPTVITNAGALSVSITVSRTDDLDYSGTMIHASTTPGFTPGPDNLVYEGNGNFYLLPATQTMYIKAAHYDTYGKTDLSYSAEYSATPGTSTSGITVVGSLPDPGASSEGDVVYLSTDDQLYTFDGTQWVAAGGAIGPGSITSEMLSPGIEFSAEIEAGEVNANHIAANAINADHISAGAVVASKISVANLSAINANMGAITAGNITLDNAGFIRGGQTAYNTGTGFYLGYSGTTYKFSIGNATQGLTWDGTAMTIKGAFTAGSININSNFTVATDGSVLIRNASTGARLEIKNDVIKVYDVNNTLRVKLGNLLAA